MTEIVTLSQEETEKEALRFAENLIKKAIKSGVFCLKGDLGAGKTTFVRAFSKAMGIDPCLVKSPTYTYLREYKGNELIIYHFDFYRLNEADDMIINELIEKTDKNNGFILIEWPEKIEHILPKSKVEIIFEISAEKNKRKIIIND